LAVKSIVANPEEIRDTDVRVIQPISSEMEDLISQSHSFAGLATTQQVKTVSERTLQVHISASRGNEIVLISLCTKSSNNERSSGVIIDGSLH
jgi:hypothetical protein